MNIFLSLCFTINQYWFYMKLLDKTYEIDKTKYLINCDFLRIYD